MNETGVTSDPRTASMIRVDQAGEYGATRIYAGQLAVMGDRHPMAREIAHGKLDCDLTILYGSAKSGDIILKDALDSIGCPRVKVVHVHSDEPDWPGEKGFLSRDIIARYAKGDSR